MSFSAPGQVATIRNGIPVENQTTAFLGQVPLLSGQSQRLWFMLEPMGWVCISPSRRLGLIQLLLCPVGLLTSSPASCFPAVARIKRIFSAFPPGRRVMVMLLFGSIHPGPTWVSWGNQKELPPSTRELGTCPSAHPAAMHAGGLCRGERAASSNEEDVLLALGTCLRLVSHYESPGWCAALQAPHSLSPM